MSGEYIKAQMTVPSGVTISVTNENGGPTDVTPTAGTYYIDTFCTELASQLNTSQPPASGEWTVTFSLTTGRVRIDCPETFSIAWTSTDLRDMLGYAADISSASSAQQGTKQARSFWRPNTPLLLDGNPLTAPRTDDGRASVSPTGDVYKVTSVTGYRAKNLRFTHVPVALVWSAAATLVNADYETFYLDTQAGVGHAWLSPASPCKVYWDKAGTLTQLGNGTVAAWKFPSPQTLDELVIPAAPWTGLVTIVLGDARSSG